MHKDQGVEHLVTELRNAQQRAYAGQLLEAKQNLEESLELLDDAIENHAGPKPSARAVRGYITKAGFAVNKSDWRGVVAAVASALKLLQPEAATGTNVES